VVVESSLEMPALPVIGGAEQWAAPNEVSSKSWSCVNQVLELSQATTEAVSSRSRHRSVKKRPQQHSLMVGPVGIEPTTEGL